MGVRRRIAVVTALVALLGVGPALAQSPQPVPNGLGIRLLEAPEKRRDDPRALVFIVDHVAPGASFTRKFEVANGTGRAAHLLLYPDAADLANGTFHLADGHGTNELTSWVRITPPAVDLANGTRSTAEVTITVPPSASSGERYAAVMAELPAQPGQGVRLATRVGIRIYLSVGPGGEPPSDFVIETLTAFRDPSGAPVVAAQVHNTGQRALDLSGDLRLTDGPSGLRAGPFPVLKIGNTLAIGQTAPLTVVLDKTLPAGPWVARIALRSGFVTREAHATITFPTTPGTSASPSAVIADSAAKSGTLLLGILLGAGLLLLILLILLVVYLMRRRTPAATPSLDETLAALVTATGKDRQRLLATAATFPKDRIMASPRLRELPVDTARELGERVAARGSR